MPRGIRSSQGSSQDTAIGASIWKMMQGSNLMDLEFLWTLKAKSCSKAHLSKEKKQANKELFNHSQSSKDNSLHSPVQMEH